MLCNVVLCVDISANMNAIRHAAVLCALVIFSVDVCSAAVSDTYSGML